MYTSVVRTGQTLHEYGTVLRTRWRWVMWGVLLALLSTTVALLVWPPPYRSEATVFVRTPGDVSRARDGGDSYAQLRARTYTAVATSRSVSERVISDLGFDMKPDTLAGRIEAQNRPGTAFIDIAVSAPSADEAERTATVLLSEIEETVLQLEAVPGSLVPRAELVVVDPPRSGARAVAGRVPVPWALVGMALFGAFTGATAAVLRAIFGSAGARVALPGDDDAPTEVSAMGEPETNSERTGRVDGAPGFGKSGNGELMESEP